MKWNKWIVCALSVAMLCGCSKPVPILTASPAPQETLLLATPEPMQTYTPPPVEERRKQFNVNSKVYEAISMQEQTPFTPIVCTPKAFLRDLENAQVDQYNLPGLDGLIEQIGYYNKRGAQIPNKTLEFRDIYIFDNTYDITLLIALDYMFIFEKKIGQDTRLVDCCYGIYDYEQYDVQIVQDGREKTNAWIVYSIHNDGTGDWEEIEVWYSLRTRKQDFSFTKRRTIVNAGYTDCQYSFLSLTEEGTSAQGYFYWCSSIGQYEDTQMPYPKGQPQHCQYVNSIVELYQYDRETAEVTLINRHEFEGVGDPILHYLIGDDLIDDDFTID